eukprot:7779_1
MGNEKSKNSNVKSDEENDGVLLNKKYKYIYGKRRCQYRTEQLEISPDEVDLITKLQKNDDMKYDPYKQILSLSNNKPVKIIIDTDIGTDIDDVFTLLLLSHLPKEDVQILGITTNYRPTILRKHIAESILKQTKNNSNDLSSIPVIAGNCYLCGTHRPFYYAGNEGKGLNINKNEMESLWTNINTTNAEDFIYKNLCKYPKQITIVSIGIPTNICNLINKYGKDIIESLIGHIVVMGGGNIITKSIKQHKQFGTKSANKRKRNLLDCNESMFPLPNNEKEGMQWIIDENNRNVIHLYPNHNLSGDTLASSIMFSLKCPITLIPHHVTSQNILRGKAIETLLLLSKTCDIKNGIYVNNENGICGVLLNEWFKVRNAERVQCLHDPLTLYEAIYPIQFIEKKENELENNEFVFGNSCLKYYNGTIVCHKWAAFVTFIPNPNGMHRIALECIDSKQWVKWCGEMLINNSMN